MECIERFAALADICRSRRSRRTFGANPLSADLIEQIKAVAYASPYASGKKNWEIEVVTDGETIARMAQAVERRAGEIHAAMRSDFRDAFAAYAKNFTAFATAPALFVPTFRVAPSLSLLGVEPKDEISRWERDNYVKSISCVAMLILLAAESLGLAACYMTGPLIAEAEIAPLVKVKTGRSIGAIIPVGHRAGEDS